MQLHHHRNKLCGTLIAQEERPRVEDILNNQVEIFSCGGVYVGTQGPRMVLKDRFQFLTLPKPTRNVAVLNHHKMHRRPGDGMEATPVAKQEGASPQENLRRFFKESLN